VEGEEVLWERETLEEMRLLFPEYSPDWMKGIIQGKQRRNCCLSLNYPSK
jgi:hypothetical protein